MSSIASSSTSYEPPPNGWRTFLTVWSTQSLSVVGSALTLFANTVWLTQTLYPRPEQKPELAFALSAMALTFGVPVIFLAPIAGAWADRHDRKRTMIVCDVLGGFLALMLAALMAAHLLQLWSLLAIEFLYALLGSFHGAAFDTSYAMLVPEKQLPRANGMMQTIWSLSGIISPGVAAFLISLPALARSGLVPGPLDGILRPLADGVPVAMTVDAATFFLSALVLLFLFIPSPRRADIGAGKPKKSLWADVREGAMYIWNRRPMLWLLGTFTVANLVGAPLQVFVPLLVKYNLAPDWQAHGMEFQTALAVLTSAGSVGGLVGGLFISTWGGLKRKRIYGILIPMAIGSVAQIIYGLSGLLYLTAAMGFIRIGMSPVLNAHSQAIWQTQTPRELQGRVFSVRRVIAQFTAPFGTLVAGLVGGVLNPGLVLSGIAALGLVFYVAQLFNPYLLRVEDKELMDSLAASAESRSRAISADREAPPAPASATTKTSAHYQVPGSRDIATRKR